MLYDESKLGSRVSKVVDIAALEEKAGDEYQLDDNLDLIDFTMSCLRADIKITPCL